MTNGGVRVKSSGNHSATAVWRGRDTLHVTMYGEATEVAVVALTDRCRNAMMGAHPVASIVLIDTSPVTGLSVSPGFMRACRELLALLKSKGTTLVVGVSDNAAIRSVASAVGFSAGLRLRIAATTEEAVALADQEASRVA